jgi:hypothetical protein
VTRELKSALKILLTKFGLDRLVVATLGVRLWSSCAAIVTVLLSAKYLSIEAQGVYYTIMSFLAFLTISEMGASFAVTQFCSHEMVNLRWNQSGILEGENISKERIQSILRFVVMWYGGICLLSLVFILPFGVWFFCKHIGDYEFKNKYLLQWVLLIGAASLMLLLSGLFAVLNGCGKVLNVEKQRIYQLIFSSVVGWIVLYCGGGLYFLVAVYYIQFIFSVIWLTANFGVFFVDLFKKHDDTAWKYWKSEILPFQSKMGVSWIAGYFLFQVFNPILLATQGPEAAGRMGMSLQIFSGINSLAQSWLSSKTPQLGQLIAKRERSKLDKIFFDSLIQSSGVLVLLVLSLLIIIKIWIIPNPVYSKSIMNEMQLIGLALVSVSNHFIFSQAIYLRAHKREPMMWHSVMMAIVLNICLFLMPPVYGLSGVVAVYAGTTVVFGLFISTIIFLKSKSVYEKI